MTTNDKARGPNVHNKSKIEAGKQVSSSLVLEVFEYWKITMGKKRAQLDIKRDRDIRWAIALYSVDGCKDAIAGCALSDFHMGKNKQKTAYNDIAVIFRDAAHVEKFQELYDAGNTSAKSNWASE